MTQTSFPEPALSGRFVRSISWVLRVLGAAAFLAAGVAKLVGAPMMVDVFDHIGLGQWFRLFAGAIEVMGAVALLLPSTVAFSGAFLAAMMLVATGVHLFVIGGSPVPAVVLMAITGTIAWLHRKAIIVRLRALRAA